MLARGGTRMIAMRCVGCDRVWPAMLLIESRGPGRKPGASTHTLSLSLSISISLSLYLSLSFSLLLIELWCPCGLFARVDLAACRRLGVRVVNVPAYSPTAIAEHALAGPYTDTLAGSMFSSSSAVLSLKS